MPRIRDRLQDRQTAARKRRELRRRRATETQRRRRAIVLRIFAVCIALAVCVLLALMVGDSDYHATAMGWVPLIAVLLVLVVALLYVQILKRGLSYFEVSELGECQRMRDIHFQVRLRNLVPLPFFRIEAHFYISDLYGNKASQAMTTLALAPFEKHEMGFTASFEHIGTYSAGLEKFVVCDFLNLFTATITNSRQQKVQVTPRLQHLDGIRFSEEALVENTRPAKTVLADSLDYAFVREYEPGDPLKTIHWNLSTRGQGLMTRMFEMPTNPSVAIIMDFYAPDNSVTSLMSIFDAVVESAFSLGDAAHKQGLDVEIHYISKHGEHVCLTTWSPEDFPRIVDDLPKMSNDKQDAKDALDLLGEQVASPTGNDNLVVCTADVGQEMCSLAMEGQMQHRELLMVGVVPGDCIGRERDDRCKALGRLDTCGARYLIVSSAEELQKEVG